MSRVSQFTVIWGADAVSFGAQNVSFGMLFASGRYRGTSEHKNGDLGVQTCISVDLKLFWDRILRIVDRLWNSNCVLCFACLQVTFSNDFGVCFWMSVAPESSNWFEKC